MLFRKKRMRNKKGAFLILEFVGIVPMFFLTSALMFDVSQLYTAVINQTLATQAAMSEIAFMGRDGEEEYVVPSAVKKANSVISFAMEKTPDGNSHQTYKYELLEFEKNNPTRQGEGTKFALPHNLQKDSRFYNSTTQEYKDHRKEVWGFKISNTYAFRHTQAFHQEVKFDVSTVQYMGILKGVKN